MVNRKLEFGNKLREARMSLGKTQSKCAVECGVCLEAYQKWERGLSTPREDKIHLIKSCLGVDF